MVGDARDVDLALIFGIGLSAVPGGLFFWADTVGAAKIVEKLKPYAPLGKRFEPTKLLPKSPRQREVLRLDASHRVTDGPAERLRVIRDSL